MAVNYSTDIKSAQMQAAISILDAQANPATLEICSAAYVTVLVSIVLSDPSFTESGGVASLASSPRSGTANAPGNGVVARIKDGLGNVKINNLTVGTVTGDIRLNSTSIIVGQTITITGGSFTHAP